MADNQFIARKGLISLDDSQITGSLSITNAVTASVFTGSFRGDGTNLYNIPSSGVTGLNLDKIISGSVSASISPNNGFRINTDVYIDGTITAKEFHTDYVTSSVLYQSGSTKFGDTLDDLHEFTGSVRITGSITLNGQAIGTGKLDETTFQSFTSSYNTGSFTGSFGGQFTGAASENLKYVGIWSGTTYGYYLVNDVVKYNNSLYVCNNNVFGNGTPDLDGSFTLLSDITPTGSFLITSSFESFTGSYNTGSFTGSFIGDGSQLTGIDGFPFTGSAKITGSLAVTGSLTVDGNVNATSFTGSIQGTATTASYVNLTNVDGFSAYSSSVSSSINSVLNATTPVTATINNTNSPFTITNQTIAIVDSTNGNVTVNLPDLNTVVGTPNQRPIIIYKNDYSQNVVFVEPNGSQLVNGTTQDIIVSIQIGIVYNPTSAGWVTEGTSYQSLAELELFFVPRTETGSLSVSTASYVEYTNVANKPSLVSGSSQISFNGITDKPTLVSGSSQITYSGLTGVPSGIISGSEQITYSGLTGTPSGIVSSSAQVLNYGIFATTGSNGFNGNQSITGSLTVTGQVVAQTLNVQQVTSSIVYSSGSNIFGNSLSNTQQFTGSLSVSGSITSTSTMTGTNFVTNGTTLYGVTLKGRSADNYGAIGYYSSDGVTRYGYIQSHSTNGGQLNITSDGGGQVIMDNRGVVVTSALYGNSAMFGSDFLSNETSKVGISFASGHGQINSWGANTSTYGGLKFQLSVSNGSTFNALTLTTTGSTFSNTETTLNFNPQTNLLASYYYLNFGGGSIMYRNTTDIYFGSNAKYGSAGTVVANYTSANGMGLLTMDGGMLRWQANNTSVTAGTAYSVPIRFAINGDGNVGIGTAAPNLSAGAAGSTILTISATTSARNGVLELNGTRTNSTDISGYVRFFNNGAATPLADIRAIRGSSDTSGDLAFTTADNERMRIDSGGTVQVKSGNELRVYRSDNARYGTFYTDGNSVHIAASVDPIRISSPERTEFYTAGTERMRVTNDNVILMGTTSTSPTNSGGMIFRATNATYGGVIILNHSTTNNAGSGFLDLYYNTNYIGGIQQNGASNVLYNTSSDYRIKEDLKDFNGLEKVSNIKVYDFKWKTEDSRSHGVLAHELQEILPYAVGGEKDQVDENGKIKSQGVDYSKLTPILIKAIQEQQEQIEILKAEIQTLKQ